MTLTMNGLTLPPEFPEEMFERIFDAMEPYRQHTNYLQFSAAWNAVAYRFMAIVEYDVLFTASIKANGPGPGEPIRYGQERDLFGFFSNAYSMFDAFHYAMYAIGTFNAPEHFQLATAEDEKGVSFRTTRKAYEAAFTSDPIVNHFSIFSSDRQRRDLDFIRNMLTHRASPPRAFRLSIGNGDAKSSAQIARLGLELNDQTTRSYRNGAIRLLSTCLVSLEAFVLRHPWRPTP